MFTQAWFWLMVAAVFFVLNVESFSTFTHFPGSGAIGGVTIMGLLVWFVFGLFCAEDWYQPVCALLLGAIISPIPYAINSGLNAIVGMAGMVIAPICVIAGYIIWF